MNTCRLVIFWFICFGLNLFDNCLASDNFSRSRVINIAYRKRSNLKLPSSTASMQEVSLYNDDKSQEVDKEQRVAIPRKRNGLARTFDTTKLRRVCKLLQNALGSLKELNPSSQEEGTSKLEDKSPKAKPKPKAEPKPNPSMCFFPCGCGGCCLMRPMIMYKVKYTPPKFKMKPLKSKTKCGHPHYGICLGRRKR